MTSVLPDPVTPFGERVRSRLRDEVVIWLLTVGGDVTPQPNPVWFLWEEPGTVLVYNRADAHRLAHIVDRPRVALHFDGDGRGGDIVVLAATARLAPDRRAAHDNPAYLAKYADLMTRVSGSPEEFGAAYPVALEIAVARVRGN